MKKNLLPVIALCFVMLAISACTNYGKKVKKDYLEVYYKDGVTKEEAQKTVDLLLVPWNEGPNTGKKSVQLIRAGDTVVFRMVVDEKKLADVNDQTLYQMANVFSDSLFNNKPVNLELTNNKFKTIRTLHYKDVNYVEEPATPADSTNQ